MEIERRVLLNDSNHLVQRIYLPLTQANALIILDDPTKYDRAGSPLKDDTSTRGYAPTGHDAGKVTI